MGRKKAKSYIISAVVGFVLVLGFVYLYATKLSF
ncbi:hypothetical protein B2K_39720 [Paenibacillus mucilaginosus K02]|uniref:Uncharacterized protein n=1 Tax=Paenibacillus mucilaginosus K02 TaxID=997761 RepID=R9ULK8_9BACL|nr:hypothetical protein B2K_39720 [Paenibacillus mucilaginosus K02]